MKVGDFVHITRKENGAKSRMDPEDVALMQARIPHTGIVVYIHPVGHWATVLCMSDSGKALYAKKKHFAHVVHQILGRFIR